MRESDGSCPEVAGLLVREQAKTSPAVAWQSCQTNLGIIILASIRLTAAPFGIPPTIMIDSRLFTDIQNAIGLTENGVVLVVCGAKGR
jgi:hypothetical protein